MPYHRGNELADVYANARSNGHGFVASNVTHPDITAGLVRGAEAVESDLVAQIKRDTAEYLGPGDVAAGLRRPTTVELPASHDEFYRRPARVAGYDVAFLSALVA